MQHMDLTGPRKHTTLVVFWGIPLLEMILSVFPVWTSVTKNNEREGIPQGYVSLWCWEICEGSITVTIETNALPVMGTQRTDWTLRSRKAMGGRGALQWEWNQLCMEYFIEKYRNLGQVTWSYLLKGYKIIPISQSLG